MYDLYIHGYEMEGFLVYGVVVLFFFFNDTATPGIYTE